MHFCNVLSHTNNLTNPYQSWGNYLIQHGACKLKRTLCSLMSDLVSGPAAF